MNHSWLKPIWICWGIVLILLQSACATRTWNAPLRSDKVGGYDFANHLPRDNSKQTFVVLAFSGGGIRSAAFSYGLLETLRDTRVVIDGKTGSLLDQVDVISSVSGGSYTAAYYGLFGRRIFRDFEAAFLRRNVKSELLTSLFNPLTMLSLTQGNYNRGDLIAGWLGVNVFKNRSFRDMSGENLPFVIINASDLNTGMTFSFIQQQFDFLCSDLSDYPVANAVAASSSVPVVFGPITVINHAGSCRQKEAQWHGWVKPSIESDSILDRRYQVARSLERYRNTERLPLIRLVDGGVTDNLGIRGSIISPVAHYGHVKEMGGAFRTQDLDEIRRVLVIVANAQTVYDYDWSVAGKEPGIIGTVDAAFNAAIGILNTETISLAKAAFDSWGDFLNGRRGRQAPQVELYFVPLTFDRIRDDREREYFNNIPTSLSLADEHIDAVRALARRLLDESPPFRQFLVRSLNEPTVTDDQ